MLDRWYTKGSSNKYDPQIGAAALANTQLAERAEAWNRDYFDKYVAPAMAQLIKESDVNIERQGKLFDLTYDQAKTSAERYKTLGIPAEDRYYKMVDEYSAPEEQERQATRALGDIRTAEAGQQQQLARQFAGLGINPASPAALSARTDNAFRNAAAEAGAMTRARDAAKTLGMQLTSDAANFGRGGSSAVLAAAGGASGIGGAGLAGATGAAGASPGGASNVNTGLGIAQKGIGSNLDAFVSRANTITQQPSALAGIGSLVGQLGSAAIAHPPSDRRLKKHTKRIATLAHDIGLWVYRYIWDADDAPLRYGYMADEVLPVFPDAVIVGPGGYMRVNYGKVLV
jgi:hypothetical protein